MISRSVLLALQLALVGGPAFGQFDNFTAESNKAIAGINQGAHQINYPSKDFSVGWMFSNLSGKAGTILFSINEEPRTGEVENIKLMWNDWTKDSGYGVHADRNAVHAVLNYIAETYAPTLKKEVFKLFFGQTDGILQSGPFTLKYTYEQGPAIGEHQLIISESE